MSNNGSSAFEVTLSFLLGTATGFILGVLFAPSSGEETRKKIKEEAEKAREDIKDTISSWLIEDQGLIVEFKTEDNTCRVVRLNGCSCTG